MPLIGKNVFDHYLKCTDEKMLSKNGLPTYWSIFFREFVNNFSITCFFYNKVEKYLIVEKMSFSDGISRAFTDANKKFGEFIVGIDGHHSILADITALVIFQY